MKPVLNRNHTFDNWTGNAPDNYTIAGTSANVRRLRRTDPRSDPKRQWFPKQFKSSDYIFDGESSFGWFGANNQTVDVSTPDVRVRPQMRISAVVAFKFNGAPPDDIFFAMVFNDAASAPIARVDQDGYTYASLFEPNVPVNLPGRPAAHRLNNTATLGVRLKDTNGDQQPYWFRYGISGIEVPTLAASVQASFDFRASASADTVFLGLGEIRIEAVDSYIHAGG